MVDDNDTESKLTCVCILQEILNVILDDTSDQKNEQTQEERLKNLSEFQISIIEHAMKCKVLPIYYSNSQFIILCIVPKAKRIVYSTCSIHAEENEHVVKAILKNNPQFELAKRDSVLPTWHRRGIPEEIDDNKGKYVYIYRMLS